MNDMEFYLLCGGIFIVLMGYLRIIYLYFKYRDKSDITGFDMAKEINPDYDHINVVESSDIVISKYYFKRNVIRLTKKMYSSHDMFSLAIVTYLSSLSVMNHQYLKWIGKIIPFMDFLNKSSLIMIFISYFIHTKGDARIGIILGVMVIIYQYFYLNIFSESINVARERVNVQKEEILSILSHLYSVNMMLFVSNLVFMLRFVMILIQ